METLKPSFFDWAVYANHAVAEVDEKIGLSWMSGSGNSHQRAWIEKISERGENNFAELMRGIFMENAPWFSSAMAALCAQKIDGDTWGKSGGQSLDWFAKLRSKETSVIASNNELLNSFLKCHLKVDGVYTRNAQRDLDVSQWALGLLKHEAKSLWISFEFMRDLPEGFARQIISNYDEIILGPDPCPYIPEIYKEWGISYVVCDYTWGMSSLLDKIRRGGHALDSKEYVLSVHSVI